MPTGESQACRARYFLFVCPREQFVVNADRDRNTFEAVCACFSVTLHRM